MGTFLAQYVMTRLVDDLDGSEAVTTLSFSLDGSSYEIDLSDPHLAAFRRAMEPYVSAARPVPGGRSARAVTRTSAPLRNGHGAPAQDVAVAEPGTGRTPAVDPPAFRQPDRGSAATAAPPKPTRAPLVADPFRPDGHPRLP
jgi:Lsr2